MTTVEQVTAHLRDPARWSATVERNGRCAYVIRITNGVVHWGPPDKVWLAYGTQAHAHRRAARLLARKRRELADDARWRQQRTVLR